MGMLVAIEFSCVRFVPWVVHC